VEPQELQFSAECDKKLIENFIIVLSARHSDPERWASALSSALRRIHNRLAPCQACLLHRSRGKTFSPPQPDRSEKRIEQDEDGKSQDNCSLCFKSLSFAIAKARARKKFSFAMPKVNWIIKELKSLTKFLIQFWIVIKTKGTEKKFSLCCVAHSVRRTFGVFFLCCCFCCLLDNTIRREWMREKSFEFPEKCSTEDEARKVFFSGVESKVEEIFKQTLDFFCPLVPDENFLWRS
jgi:hypothetical protein